MSGGRVLAVAGGARERSRGQTAARSAHARLRDEILSLRRVPGLRLGEQEIADAFGVSRTPVREALQRLAAEGLVDMFPKSGAWVSRIPLAALPETIAIRSVLEQMTARAAAAHASRSEIIGLGALVARMDEAAEAGDREGFHAADEDFHEAVARAGRLPGVWRLVKQVKIQVDRFRRLTLPLEGRMARTVGEHEAVLRAVAARDPEGAAAAMGRHIDGLNLGMDDIARFNPDYFEHDPTEAEAIRG